MSLTSTYSFSTNLFHHCQDQWLDGVVKVMEWLHYCEWTEGYGVDVLMPSDAWNHLLNILVVHVSIFNYLKSYLF